MARGQIEDNPFFSEVFDDDREDDDNEDDGAIHITRDGKRYVFYNGQGKGMFTERDIPRFANFVDECLGDDDE
jgi:hypothetical protein